VGEKRQKVTRGSHRNEVWLLTQGLRYRAACDVCQASRRQRHSVDLLMDLHWLPVRGRVDYKVAVFSYKAVKLQQPSYLTCLLSPDSRVSWGHLRQTSFLRTADSFTSLGLGSRLTCLQHICSQSTLRASDTLTRSFTRYKFVTYLLTCYVYIVVQLYFLTGFANQIVKYLTDSLTASRPTEPYSPQRLLFWRFLLASCWPWTLITWQYWS